MIRERHAQERSDGLWGLNLQGTRHRRANPKRSCSAARRGRSCTELSSIHQEQ